MPFPCFWVDELDDVDIALRRYVSTTDESRKCAGRWGYHNASVTIERVVEARDERQPIRSGKGDFDGDTRWPTKCDACNYEFTDDDEWQVSRIRVFRERYGDREWDDRTLPPGAMLDGFWHPQKGPDGIALVVVLPPPSEDGRSHWWHVDGPSRNQGVPGPGWSRTGDPTANPPTVQASPSILTSDYHGFLQVIAGCSTLTDDLDRR